MKKLKNIWSKRKPGSRGRGVRRDYFFFDRCHNFFLPTVRKKKLRRSVVHLLSKAKTPSTKQAEKYRKTIDSKWNRWFLVEISGIEPLTSWMPFKRSPSWAIPPYELFWRCVVSLSARVLYQASRQIASTFFIFFDFFRQKKWTSEYRFKSSY